MPENGRKFTLPVAIVIIGILWTMFVFVLGAMMAPHAKIIEDYAALKGKVEVLEKGFAANTSDISGIRNDIKEMKTDLKEALKK